MAGLAAVAVVGRLETELARHKPFWRDEEHDFAHTCRAPLHVLLAYAPAQVNPAPFYFLLEKLTVDAPRQSAAGILVRYRLPSLVLAVLTLAVVFAVMLVRLGVPWAFSSLASLAGQPLFHWYAAESRPYAAWIASFTVLMLVGAGALGKGTGRRSWRLALVASCLLASVTAVPGSGQALVTLGVCTVVWLGIERVQPVALRWLVPLAAACLGLGLLYGLATSWQPEASHLQLTSANERRHLLESVSALLWIPGVLGAPGNLLLLAGLGAAVDIRARAPGPARRYAATLSLLCGAQLLLTLALALAVVARSYYFLPRLFLHLVVCRALLLAVGGYWLVALVSSRARPRLRLGITTASTALALVALLAALDRLSLEVAEVRARYPWKRAGAACLGWRGQLSVWIPGEAPELALGANALARLGEELERCGWQHDAPESHVFVGGLNEADKLAVTAEPPLAARRLELCGRPVVLRPPSR